MSVIFSEALEMSRVRWYDRLLLAGLLLSLSCIILIATVSVYFRLDEQLDKRRIAESDNTTWVISQLEVDMLQLRAAVSDALLNDLALDLLENVRKRFNIYYSRVTIMKEANMNRTLGTLDSFETIEEDLFFEEFMPFVDGPDQLLAATLQDMATAILNIQVNVRRRMFPVLQEINGNADRARIDMRSTLQNFVAMGLALIWLSGTMLILGFRQLRDQRRRRSLTESAVHNLRATIESSLDGVIVVDSFGSIIDCNVAAEEMFGWSRATKRGTNFKNLIGAENDQSPVLSQGGSISASGEFSPFDTGRRAMTARHSDGTKFQVEVSVVEAQGANKEPIFIAFIRDITERIEREESLREARNAVLEGEAAKTRFLAVISHEMRTPLSGVMAATEILTSFTKLDERQKRLCETIYACGTAVLAQINNVLDLTRLGEVDGDAYPVVAFSVPELIADLVRQSQPLVERQHVSLVFEREGGPPANVIGQRQLIARVIQNFVGNAIKFTDQGNITVKFSAHENAARDMLDVVVSVTDTGVGIAKHDLERIFWNFETLDSSFSRMREGTGLGLGIAKLSAEAMGGKISVQSTLGKGSIFSFHVALAIAQIDVNDVSKASFWDVGLRTLRPLTILLAEDNTVNRELIAEMLRLAGHEVIEVENGAMAVNHARGRAFDVVLMDISMPLLDGLEATRLIREKGPSRMVPIIGVTANANPQRIGEFKKSGMDSIIFKPLKCSELLEEIARFTKYDTQAESSKLIQTSSEFAPVVQSPMIDEDIFQEVFSGLGQEYLSGIIIRFEREAEEAVAEITALHQANALKDATQLSHQTAGGAAAIGMIALHKVFAFYEASVQNKDMEGAVKALGLMKPTMMKSFDDLRRRGLL